MLRNLPPITDPRALVGAATHDDAAVYQLTDDLAIVTTVDFITPIVDDPYDWGMIAAANALSDVYAMGAQPLFALNTVSFPRDTLPLDMLERVLAGGSAKTQEAGVSILGGHSIDDPEPKYGMVVVGMVHPARVRRNRGAVPGDALLITKPLGTGILATAIKKGRASEQEIAEGVSIMSTLNRSAAEVLAQAGDTVHAVTDVTGFGLLGHLAEMVAGGVGVELSASAVPVIPAIWPFVEEGLIPGGTRRNLAAVSESTIWGPSVSEGHRLVLADAQTSGGLLVAVAADAAPTVLAELRAQGVHAARIGTFSASYPGRIRVG